MSKPNWKANLIALFIAQLCAMMAFSFVFPFIPLYVHELGVHDPAAAARWAGAIGAAAAITMAFAQPFWGGLADRYGRRVMVLRSIAAASLTLALMGLARHPWHLLVLRLLQGAFTGTLAASSALVAASVPRERLGASLGLMQVTLYVGTAVGPLIGGLIADQLGYRVSCFAAGALLLLSALLVLAFVRERFEPPATGMERPSMFAGNLQLLAVPGFVLIMSIAFLIQFGTSIVSPVLALFIRELAAGTNAATNAGVVMAGTGVASALAAVLAGRIGDRVGHRRVLPVCLLGAALICVPQAFVRNTGQLFVLRFSLGLFLGGLMPTANALLAGLVPVQRRGAAFGLGATAVAIANAAGPISGALTASLFGMRAVFGLTAALYAMGFAFVLRRFAHLPTRSTDASQSLAPDPME